MFQSNLSHKRLNDEIVCYSECNEDVEKNKTNNDEEEVVLFVEFKYCTICHLEQVRLLH